MCGLCAGFEQIGVRENVRVFGKSAKFVRFLPKKLWQHYAESEVPKKSFKLKEKYITNFVQYF